MVQQSFGDRVEVFAVSVPLLPSLGRIQHLSGIKQVTRYLQQVILVLLIYCCEDRATLILIHISNLSTGIKAFVVTLGLTISTYLPLVYLSFVTVLFITYSPLKKPQKNPKAL